MGLFNYFKVLRKYNTLKNEHEVLLQQHDDDVRDKTYLSNEVRKYKTQLRKVRTELKELKNKKRKKKK